MSAGGKVMETEAVCSEGWKKDGLVCDKRTEGARTPQRTLRSSAHGRRGCGQPRSDTGNRLGLSSGLLVKRSGMSLRTRPGVCLHAFVWSSSVPCLWGLDPSVAPGQAFTARIFHGPVFLNVSHPRHLVLLPVACLVPTSAKSHPSVPL